MKFFLWLRRWGGWVLGGLAALVAAFALLFRKKAQPLPSPTPERKDAEKKAEELEEQAKDSYDKRVEELNEQLNSDLAVLVDKQTDQAKELESDPKATNEWLKKVGKDVRE